MEINVKTNTYIYLVLLLFLVPLPWLLAWLVAVAFHELCHWVAVKLCDGEIYRLTVGIGGANMESGMLQEWKSILAVLSGPVGGFALVLLGKWLPRVAVCSWLLSVYNLLPLLPLDGGRALQFLMGDTTYFYIAEKIFLCILSLAAVYAAIFLHLGVLPLAIVGGLWLKNRKTPCKKRICKVQ